MSLDIAKMGFARITALLAASITALTAVLTGTVFVLGEIFGKPPHSEGSVSFSLIQSTFGVAITAVTATVALLLAAKALQGTEKEKTVALLAIYDAEIDRLFAEVNMRQESLCRFVIAASELAKSGHHLSLCVAYYAAERAFAEEAELPQLSEDEILRLVEFFDDEEIFDQERQFVLDAYMRKWMVSLKRALASDVESAEKDAQFYGGQRYSDFDRKIYSDPRLYLSSIAHSNDESPEEYFSPANAIADFKEKQGAALSTFRALCEHLVESESGLYHRVIGRSFSQLVDGPYRHIQEHLVPDDVRFTGGEDYSGIWPLINVSSDGYLAISQFPEFMEHYSALPFLKPINFTVRPQLTNLREALFKRRVRTTGAFDFRGFETPEDLGSRLGMYLPAVSGYQRHCTPVIGFWRSEGTIEGFAQADQFPDDEFSDFYSPIFTYLIPFIIRLIAPSTVVRELQFAMRELEMDEDLCHRHILVKSSSLFSYEAFGDQATAPPEMNSLQDLMLEISNAESELSRYKKMHEMA